MAAARRPTMWLVREKYVPREPFQNLVFGVFNRRNFALESQKRVTGGAKPVVAQAELLPLDLNYRYDLGISLSVEPPQ